MTERTHYKPGEFYRICDRSGFKVRSSKTKKEWDGYVVRNKSWEVRHPQDLVRGVADDQTVPEARPRPHTIYVKLPILLEAYGPNYGVPIYSEGGGLIYRDEGLGTDEVPIVVPDDFPNSW
jgi:hypothetical protein